MPTKEVTPETLVITLSEQAPVKIVVAEWPCIASAQYHDGEHESQAGRRAGIRVREHADGRRVVYGWSTSRYRGERDQHAGFLVIHDPTERRIAGANATVRAIRRVAGAIGHNDIANDCIADLPAEAI